DVEGTEKLLDQLAAGRPIFGLPDGWQIDLAELREQQDGRQAALARSITVDHGKFFRDVKGRLDAWQHLEIRDVYAFVDTLDALLRESYASKDGASDLRSELGCTDDESSRRIASALAKRERFLEVVEGAVVWHVAASETAARALANRIEKGPSL